MLTEVIYPSHLKMLNPAPSGDLGMNKCETEFTLLLILTIFDILCYGLLTIHSSMFFRPCYKLLADIIFV